MDTIKVNFTDGEQGVNCPVEERVYADRSCGQYESGWAVYNPHDFIDYFVSQSGEVYAWGTGNIVGDAPVISAEADRMERELDRLYATEGM